MFTLFLFASRLNPNGRPWLLWLLLDWDKYVLPASSTVWLELVPTSWYLPLLQSVRSHCLWYQWTYLPAACLPQDSATFLVTRALPMNTLNVIGSSVFQPCSCPDQLYYLLTFLKTICLKKNKLQVCLRRRPCIIGNKYCLIEMQDSHEISILKIKHC